MTKWEISLFIVDWTWKLGEELNFDLKFSLEADPSSNWNENGVFIGKAVQEPIKAKDEHYPHFSDQ